MGCEGELEQRGCKVVMVLKGTQSSAKEWMDIYKFPYPLFLDPELEFFKELGLKRSLTRVWRLPILIGYAEDHVAGVAFTPPWEGDDIHLTAGDYVADSSGKLVYAFNASHSHDRPSTEQILGALPN